jgi:hypothetical protein
LVSGVIEADTLSRYVMGDESPVKKTPQKPVSAFASSVIEVPS